MKQQKQLLSLMLLLCTQLLASWAKCSIAELKQTGLWKFNSCLNQESYLQNFDDLPFHLNLVSKVKSRFQSVDMVVVKLLGGTRISGRCGAGCTPQLFIKFSKTSIPPNEKLKLSVRRTERILMMER